MIALRTETYEFKLEYHRRIVRCDFWIIKNTMILFGLTVDWDYFDVKQKSFVLRDQNILSIHNSNVSTSKAVMKYTYLISKINKRQDGCFRWILNFFKINNEEIAYKITFIFLSEFCYVRRWLDYHWNKLLVGRIFFKITYYTSYKNEQRSHRSQIN